MAGFFWSLGWVTRFKTKCSRVILSIILEYIKEDK
jgi:hypothetical protein